MYPFHRLQFSLGSVLVLVTLLAGWLAIHINATAKQRTAVSAIRRLGGTALYDYECDIDGNALFGPFLYARRRPTITDGLRKALGPDFLNSVVSVQLNGTPVADADLHHLIRLTDLKRLYLSSTMVTDESVEYLGRLTNLRYVDVSDTRMTETGVSNLQRSLPQAIIHEDLEYRRLTRLMEAIAVDPDATSEMKLNVMIDP